MKKLSKDAILRSRRIARKRRRRHRRSSSEKALRALLRSVTPHETQSIRRTREKLGGRRILIHAPEVFGITADVKRTYLVEFIDLIQRYARSNLKVHIDFSNTKKMEPSGTLLFAAALDTVLRGTRDRGLITCSYPDDPVVEQLLQHFGLLQRMGLRPRRLISAENVKYWRYSSGDTVDGEKTAPTIADYEELFPDGPSKKLYNALAEAMTNSKHHAYIDERGLPRSGDPGQWWMFSQYKDGVLFVSICDLGVGIPNSLIYGRKWTPSAVKDQVRRFTSRPSRRDSDFIRAALELGKSRTDQEYRGKGLQELRNVIEASGTGWLRILSNRGSYAYSALKGEERTRDFQMSIRGTLIEWRITKAAEQHEKD